MAEIVKMPKLSDTMEEGVVAEWHKKVGDKVKSGELLAEIETDKATMEFESFQDGVLLHIGVEKGAAAPVDSILAILGKEGEDIKSLLESGSNGGGAPAEAKAPKEEKAEAPKAEKSAKAEPEEKVEAPAKEVTKSAPEPVAATNGSDGRIKASPLAKRLAEDKGIALTAVKGSGDGGRIVMRDIENYKPSAASGSGQAATAGQESYREEPVSQMRKTIAKRLSESKYTAPHFYLTMEIDMSHAMKQRTSINAALEPAKVSFNDMVIKSVAAALRKHPKVNASWRGDKIRYNDHIHIGVAVAVDEGLLVPVVRFADTKSLLAINGEVKEYADKARNKKLQPSDWEGSTFTISNLGMFGIEEFTAIINTPDACILAIGTIVEKPVVKNGAIVIGNTMKVTLSCDHRVVDGAVGSAFLQTFKKYMENPVLMLAD
jgi:pyruvate dehydrogenase E2 component (dihydrolipoamide acetyltransferase)